MPILRPPRREDAGTAVQIDSATRRNLELAKALSGGREGTLIPVIDRTVTAGGARLLERPLAAPLRDIAKISARHDTVAFWLENRALADEMRQVLRRIPDMDRAMARISLGRAGPRDLAAVRDGMMRA